MAGATSIARTLCTSYPVKGSLGAVRAHTGYKLVQRPKKHTTLCTIGAVSADDVSACSFRVACPICTTTGFTVDEAPKQDGKLSCSTCGRDFSYNNTYLDLTLGSGVESNTYTERAWAGTELFRTQAMSYIYERGWRQLFIPIQGFPGPEKEFEYAMDYLEPAYGDVVVDLSCGSGLFTRRLAKSKRFPGVIAIDRSENMLEQAKQFEQEDAELDGETKILQVVADVARLPFQSGTIAGIHSGAAMHCWESPLVAMAEISRVLRPGGVYVASTMLSVLSPFEGGMLGAAVVKQVHPEAAFQFRYFQEKELEDLSRAVGLEGFQRHRSRQFIMFSVTKPTS